MFKVAVGLTTFVVWRLAIMLEVEITSRALVGAFVPMPTLPLFNIVKAVNVDDAYVLGEDVPM